VRRRRQNIKHKRKYRDNDSDDDADLDHYRVLHAGVYGHLREHGGVGKQQTDGTCIAKISSGQGRSAMRHNAHEYLIIHRRCLWGDSPLYTSNKEETVALALNDLAIKVDIMRAFIRPDEALISDGVDDEGAI
jgi:hypothetical protein